MSLLVEIVSVLQTIDLRSGRTANSLVLGLPDGLKFQVGIDEASLQVLLARAALATGATSTPEDDPVPSTDEGTTNLTFGSNEVEDPRIEPDQVAVFGVEAPKAQTSQPSAGHKAVEIQGQVPRVRKQKPAMDDMGYPVMPANSGGRDPGEIVGTGSNQDEDGVPSL